VLDNNVYVPVITENGTDIKITYRGNCNGKTVSKEYEGKGYITKGDRGLMMEKFFITPASITATSKNDCLEYTTSTNGATMEFINPLLADGFSLMLNFSKMQTNASLKFVLKDFANAANTVEVKMADDNGNYSLWVNGEQHELSSFAPNADYYLVFDNLQSRVGLKDMAGATTYFSVSDEQYYFSSFFDLFFQMLVTEVIPNRVVEVIINHSNKVVILSVTPSFAACTTTQIRQVKSTIAPRTRLEERCPPSPDNISFNTNGFLLSSFLLINLS
jgi:hypothetical protein